MLNKVKAYFGEIREAEKLERRNMKKWEENGTMEEALKVFKLQKRKQRNNAIAGFAYLAGLAGLLAIANSQATKETKQRKAEQATKENNVTEMELFKRKTK